MSSVVAVALATVANVLDRGSPCLSSMATVGGLSLQCLDRLRWLDPDALVGIEHLVDGTGSPAVIAFSQPVARDALARVVARMGRRLPVRSVWRSLVQQYLLYRWSLRGQGNVHLAARPGHSADELGLALDTAVFDLWRTALEAEGWQWLGPRDQGHFVYTAVNDWHHHTDLSVRAFQALWNFHRPEQSLELDGSFGPLTENALLLSPAGGFPTDRRPASSERFERLLFWNPAALQSGPEVRWLQSGLARDHGLAPGQVDGRFGPMTALAVRRFQWRHGLRPDGIVGPVTRAVLGERGIPDVGLAEAMAKANVSSWDSVLLGLSTEGASSGTAARDRLPPGPEASARMAERDWPRLKAFAEPLRQAARAVDLPVALLAAIASRESRAGQLLDAGGWGERGRAFGVMQVDQRVHRLAANEDPSGPAHLHQAARILRRGLDAVRQRHSDWRPEDQLRGALAAYDAGIDSVRHPQWLDMGTTGGDYSADVLARARWLARQVPFVPTRERHRGYSSRRPVGGGGSQPHGSGADA
ncbi:MAG: hypothetical protein ERJ67_05955 [Aphanocapsa feldmannii 277cV]|uniref:Peptidoglycan binding-like domain-containing protein n=1 Tax=Aphanocapsa feldmannii 277cV TaxID=2507553 RepID=A0A524RN44_9CHRO|nr:MAG: hypothetical protein ERJ67_05955 [Aphanocapsa feldmannii 277cV]